MTIKELTTYDETVRLAMDGLMRELSAESICTEEQLRRSIEAAGSHVYIACDGDEIIGCGTLCVCETPEQRLGFIEAIVVRSDRRGEGIGRAMMEHILAEAGTLSPIQLHLTSNPRRVAANGLYRALGFTHKETNVYIMEL